LISLNQNNEEIKNLGEEYYQKLLNGNAEVLFDDRPEVRPGIKFNDADLIGIPVQLILGEKNLKTGNVEIKIRKTGERIILKKEDALRKVLELINEI
ncbi:MAG: His/Gly/Thr/Pro-type tRNA ligase C-terminal domain-containing protein, partial [bacterium]